MFITPAVAGDSVYVGSCAGSFYAFDADTGDVLWRHDTAEDGTPAQFHGDALVTEDLVVVGSDAVPQGHLYAFDRASGEIRWKLPFPGGVTSHVLRHGDTALAVAKSAEVVALDLDTGSLRWLADGPEGVAGDRVWDPALEGGRLFVGWRPGVVDAYDAATGELLWRRELGAPVNTSVAIFRGEPVVGTLGPGEAGRLVRLSAETGEVLGTADPGGAPYGDLQAAGDCLLVLAREGGLGPEANPEGGHVVSCLEPGLEAARWRLASETEWFTDRPLVHGDQIVIGNRERFLGVARADGEVLWERAVGGTPRGVGGSHRYLYFGTLGGEVQALRWRGGG